ncbi:MAG: hypothetical protein ABSG94_12960 [Brevinematales bacterium]|jgi:hypothetical protein
MTVDYNMDAGTFFVGSISVDVAGDSYTVQDNQGSVLLKRNASSVKLEIK